jgi:hypothetical protein
MTPVMAPKAAIAVRKIGEDAVSDDPREDARLLASRRIGVLEGMLMLF